MGFIEHVHFCLLQPLFFEKKKNVAIPKAPDPAVAVATTPAP